MSIDEQAKQNFISGFSCAESVLLAASSQSKGARQTESCVPRIATGFGGGIAGNGNICGALSGGIMAISLALGRDKPQESRERCYAAVDRFYSEFLKTFGTCSCRELTGVGIKTPEEWRVYQNEIRMQRCSPIVAWAANTANQIIHERTLTFG
jgi:C_GCAxxG_C_C family probable redox protein